jgi:hypothetical protein
LEWTQSSQAGTWLGADDQAVLVLGWLDTIEPSWHEMIKLGWLEMINVFWP